MSEDLLDVLIGLTIIEGRPIMKRDIVKIGDSMQDFSRRRVETPEMTGENLEVNV